MVYEWFKLDDEQEESSRRADLQKRFNSIKRISNKHSDNFKNWFRIEVVGFIPEDKPEDYLMHTLMAFSADKKLDILNNNLIIDSIINIIDNNLIIDRATDVPLSNEIIDKLVPHDTDIPESVNDLLHGREESSTTIDQIEVHYIEEVTGNV